MFNKKEQLKIIEKMLNNIDLSSGLFLGCIDNKVLEKQANKNILCPYDGRLLVGCVNSDFNKDCSNYCLKDIMSLFPDIKQSVLNKMIFAIKHNKYNLFYFKKKNITLPALLSREEKKRIQEKLEEKTNSREEEFHNIPEYKLIELKEKQLAKNLVCVYGNNTKPLPNDLFEIFLEKLSLISAPINIVEMKNKNSYNIWHNTEYVGNFSLNDISIGISYYIKDNKKIFWCHITRGDNITVKNLEGCVVFESIFEDSLEPLFLLFKQKSKIYNTPSKTHMENKNIIPYENLLCDTCSLLNVCNGGCPYRRLANIFVEKNNIYF